jgi:mannose-6-phosphate isomerase class I
MTNKEVESTRNRPAGERTIDTSQLLIDIPSFIKQIKSEKQWTQRDRNSITVFKSDKLRIVITGLRKNAEMHTQHPENVLSLYIISGEIMLETQFKNVKIGRGQILALHEKVPYTIKAAKKTMMLLTIVD